VRAGSVNERRDVAGDLPDRVLVVGLGRLERWVLVVGLRRLERRVLVVGLRRLKHVARDRWCIGS